MVAGYCRLRSCFKFYQSIIYFDFLNNLFFPGCFFSGPLDPSQTSFVNQSSVVVCTMGINQQLVLEPRDEYSNICSYSPSADHSNSYAINVIDVSTSKY